MSVQIDMNPCRFWHPIIKTVSSKFAHVGLRLRRISYLPLTFQAGPLARYRGIRDDHVDNSAVAALSKIGDSIELGAYIGGGAPLQRLGINDPGTVAGRISFGHDVNEGHDGFLVEGSLSFTRPVTDGLKSIFSLSTSYASGQYMDAVFDVSAADSVANGLAPFSASAGFKDIGITGVTR